MPLPALISPPPLMEGDSLTAEEFLRRWEEMLDVKHAELIVEVAVSSYSRDFGAKKRLYQRMGVRKYLIAVPQEEKLVYFGLTDDGYQTLEADAAGIIRSVCFPGLWLCNRD